MSDYDIPEVDNDPVTRDQSVQECKKSIMRQAAKYELQANMMFFAHMGVDAIVGTVAGALSGGLVAVVFAIDAGIDLLASGEIIQDIGDAAKEAAKKCECN